MPITQSIVAPLNETDLVLTTGPAAESSAGLVGVVSGDSIVSGLVSASVTSALAGDVTLIMDINVAGPVAASAGAAYTSGVYAEVFETVSGPVATSDGAAPAGVVSAEVNMAGPVAMTAGAAAAGGIATSTLGPTATAAGAAPSGTLTVEIVLAGVTAISSSAAFTDGVIAGVSVDVSGVVASSVTDTPGGDVSGSAEIDGAVASSNGAAFTDGISTAVNMAPAPATSVAAASGEVDTDAILLGEVSTSVAAAVAGDISASDVFTGNISTSTAMAYGGEVHGDANIVGEVATSSTDAFAGEVTGDANIVGEVATSLGACGDASLYIVRVINVKGHTSQSRAAAVGDVSVGISPFITATPAYSVGSAPGGTTHGSARMTAWPATSVGRTYEPHVVTEANVSLAGPEALSYAIALIGAIYYDWAVFGEVAESTGAAIPGRTDLTPLFVLLRAVWRVSLGLNQRQREMVDIPPHTEGRPGRSLTSTDPRVMRPSRRSMVELPRTMSPEVRE